MGVPRLFNSRSFFLSTISILPAQLAAFQQNSEDTGQVPLTWILIGTVGGVAVIVVISIMTAVILLRVKRNKKKASRYSPNLELIRQQADSFYKHQSTLE